MHVYIFAFPELYRIRSFQNSIIVFWKMCTVVLTAELTFKLNPTHATFLRGHLGAFSCIVPAEQMLVVFQCMCNANRQYVQLRFVFCATVFCVLCFVLVQLCRELAGWQQRWMRSHTVCPYWQYCCTKHKTHLHICCTLHTLAQSNSTQTQSILVLSHVTQWWFIILHLPPNELKSFDRRIIHCARILQSMDSINIHIW